MNGLLPRRDGYLVLLLALVMFALAALHLASLRERDEPEPGPPAGSGGGGAAGGPPVTIEFTPRPFLFYFLREAGFDLRITSSVPEDPRGALLVIHPPEKVDPAFARDLFRFVESGGGLLLFCPEDHALARLAGAQISGEPLPEEAEWSFTTPAYRDVGPISGRSGGIGRRRGASLVFTGEAGEAGFLTAFTGRGSGLIHLIATRDLYTATGLARAGNALLVTRLCERLASRATGRRFLHIWREDPGLVVQARVRGPGAGEAPAPGARSRKKKELTLWNLLSANPASLVFAQIALGLILFARTLARRPARPVPAPPLPAPRDTFAAAMARLHLRRGAQDYLAARLARELCALVRKKAGSAEPDEEALFARLAAASPDLARRAERLRAALRERARGGELLPLSRELDALGKEWFPHA